MPPNSRESSLKWLMKLVFEPISRTRKASSVPPEAIDQNVFCQRKVARVPAIRIPVIRATMKKPPTKIHPLSVCRCVPAEIRSWLLNTVPSVTRIGPSANTGK